MSRRPTPPPRRSSISSPTKLVQPLSALSTASSSAGPSGPSIPARSSSTRTKPLWRPRDAKRPRAELEAEVKSLTDDISRKVKKLKPSASYDSDFWTANAEISNSCEKRAGLESCIGFLDFKKGSSNNVSEADWQTMEKAQNLERQVMAYRQAEAVAKKQASRLLFGETGLGSVFVKLFSTSPQGLSIKAGVGTRDNSAQSNMVQEMREKYCGQNVDEGRTWDPIAGRWLLSGHLRAAHLYAWRQVDSMDAIFGPGSRDEIFSAGNGLFLTEKVEKALDQGLLAIVPNVDLEPKDHKFPRDDLENRNQRLRDWEKAKIKEYKVVILDPGHQTIKAPYNWLDKEGNLRPFADLDGKPLEFNTDFRPRARYVWWTFMSAIMQTAYRQKQNHTNLLIREVNKATRYWGTRGRYVKKNMLRGFVDELGQDIDSILENAMDDADTDEAAPDAVAVVASETILRAQDAARSRAHDEDEDEDEEDEDEDEDEEDEDEDEDEEDEDEDEDEDHDEED